jgi:hypothetical protein
VVDGGIASHEAADRSGAADVTAGSDERWSEASGDVEESSRAGVLPPPEEEKLPSSPLSTDELSPGALPLPRWVGVLAASCAILLVPWIVYLAIKLPQQTRAANYDVAWVGFDIAMFLALAGLGICALRRSTYTEVLAAVTGTLLVTDAWFDVITADTRMHRIAAFTSAVLIELPLAALCAWVAQNAERVRRRAYRQLWRLARSEGLLARNGLGPESGQHPSGRYPSGRRPGRRGSAG